MPKHVYTACFIERPSVFLNKLEDMSMTSIDANTGAAKSNVATMNLQTNDSSISKFLCGTFVVYQLICCQAEDVMFFLITQ